MKFVFNLLVSVSLLAALAFAAAPQKPVIVSYLLDVVEELKRDEASGSEGKLTEWQIYELIINKLMVRSAGKYKTVGWNA